MVHNSPPDSSRPANTNCFTCIPILTFNNTGTCGWCLSCMLLDHSSFHPPNPVSYTFYRVCRSLTLLNGDPYNSVNTGWIRHSSAFIPWRSLQRAVRYPTAATHRLRCDHFNCLRLFKYSQYWTRRELRIIVSLVISTLYNVFWSD